MKSPEYLVFDAVPLARGTHLRLENARGTVVYARSGEIWMTQEGEQRDILLKPGQGFRIERAGATVISALRTGAIALYPARSAAGGVSFAERLASLFPA